MKKTLIYPTGHPAPRGAYSPGLLVEHGGMSTLYVTGQLAVDPRETSSRPMTRPPRPSTSLS
jgi:enamine deaminase RidA (YjgF/YER057c/UK114 family)